jgi:hypothetical protein
VQSLQPRQVEPHAPWRWSREALGLIGRRPLAFSIASLVLLATFFSALQADHAALRFAIVLTLPPLGLTGFVRLAQAADHGHDMPLTGFFPTNRETLRVLGLGVLGYGVIFALIFAMGGMGIEEPGLWAGSRWKHYARLAVESVGLPFAWAVKGVLFGTSLAAFSGVMLGLFAWFLLPLMQLGNARTLLALRLSVDAYRLNARTLGITSFATLGAVVGALFLSLGLAALLMAPFVGAMLYVSYREIFLGRAQNAPVRVQRVAAAAVGA